jgi:hypothetical protein
MRIVLIYAILIAEFDSRKKGLLMKTALITGASSGIADHHNTSQFKKY